MSRNSQSADAPRLSRRQLLQTAGGLVIGVALLPRGSRAQSPASAGFAPNAFVRIASDSTVTVMIKHLDKGQGIATGLTTIIAEELDASWSQMRSAFAPARADLYSNLYIPNFQVTGSSTSISNSFDQLRQAGAMARALLVAAAARKWNAPAGEIIIRDGIVSHRDRKATFGELAADAATLSAPANVKPKDPKDYRLIGLDRPGMRLDNVDKTTGRAMFTIDVMREGMKVAMVARPPKFGATPRSVNIEAVKTMPGVREVVPLPFGVAVIADDTWSAIKAKRALVVDWDFSKAETRGTDALMALYRETAQKPGDVAEKRGDVAGVFAKSEVIEATYEVPYLAHAPMEPINITLAWTPGQKAELWYGSQGQSIDQQVVAQILDLKPEQVSIETLWAGGSFGRRTTPGADFAVEIAVIAKATGGRWPLKLQYMREDDMRSGWYRPISLHRLRAALGPDGMPAAWHDRIVSQSIAKGTALEPLVVKDGIDATSVEGASDLPYAIPNFLTDVSTPPSGVPVCWWRAVGHTHTAFATETFLDELAAKAGKDPVAYRLALLDKHERHRAVLRLAAEKSGWGQPLPKGRGRGVALHESFSSFVANVVEVTVAKNGKLKIDRVVCAVDCGRAINPDIIRAQMEGGIGFALSAVLRGEITLVDGEVQQENFDLYEPLRLSEMPAVEVHIVPSQAHPTGVGEPGVPCVAPAVANAIFAATGKRIRTLPLTRLDLSWA